ncbi:MAG TPA: hypothetical protein VFM19_00280 [Candidatus Limnocylindria bacterium]|nr:hypothetical protein [Candidatus Limnocylindria bacterium]
MSRRTEVYLEIGAKRTFASAVVWPGWSRSGRTPDEALEALSASAPRYAAVARRARVAFRAPGSVDELVVVARRTGDGGTDFGVPGVPAPTDGEPLAEADLKRWRGLLRAAWWAWDAAAESARGITLRTGPRGGGRTLAKMRTHVLEAEEAYLHQLGSRRPALAKDAGEDERLASVRDAALAALELLARGEPLPDPNRVRKAWSPRYFIRRSAWHALDHAWELEDRSSGG